MSSTLYNEAIKAAEEIKLAAEEKVKQHIVESISPQIKSLVEKRLFESKEETDSPVEESEESSEECGNYESVEETEENKVELNAESRRILNKLINSNAKKEAAHQKLESLKESLKSLQKAITISESSNLFHQTKPRVVVLYKNLLNEVTNLKTNSIIRSDKELLKEFYKLNKEIENMSRRRSNSKYLNESLSDLLEMDLFEADGDEEELDLSDEAADLPEDEAGEEAPEEQPAEADEDLEVEEVEEEGEELEITDQTTVRELAIAAGLVEEDENVGEELELEIDEALFETEKPSDEEGEEEGEEEPKEEGMYESRDRILEIDENMLKREIGRMKALREGEAKDVASHFGGGSIEGEAFVDGVELNKLHEMKTKAAKVVRMNRMLESKLSQYKKALRGMKDQLTEMNLFNAKLLYANKLMQNRELSMKQQRHIVESLDNAKTLGEAKILFESLSKSIANPTRKNNLAEGSVRRPLNSSSQPVRSAQTLNESAALDRWATLAGIKN